MNKKSGFFQKAEKLLSGKGFYMVLLLCLVILGASGFFLYRTVSDLIPDEPVNAQAEITVPTPDTVETFESGDDTVPVLSDDIVETVTEPESVEVSEPIIEEAEPVIEEPEAEPVAAPVEDVVVPVSKPVLGWPVVGEVVSAFSASELTYHEVLGDWRTHNGVDIAADVGTEVLAATGGTVESISNDPLTGTTLTLSHEGGMTTVYGNLDADTLCVAEGDAVEAGQTLGNVGSAAVESTQPCLHFAITVDGENVDPAEYLG